MTRVFILQELICDLLEKDGLTVNRTATRYAAMAHDVGRIDDGLDSEHGERSAIWMKKYLGGKVSPEDLTVAMYCVQWHVPPDSEAPLMSPELKVLKDADGLERVRLGDLNSNYLRTDAAKSLIDLAQQLYETSRQYMDSEKAETFEDVVNAAKRLKLIKEELV